MAASQRDSVISTTSSGSVERVEFELRNDSLDGDGANRYTVDYASTEALLKEQMKTTDKNIILGKVMNDLNKYTDLHQQFFGNYQYGVCRLFFFFNLSILMFDVLADEPSG